jgi:hypothetical protein
LTTWQWWAGLAGELIAAELPPNKVAPASEIPANTNRFIEGSDTPS